MAKKIRLRQARYIKPKIKAICPLCNKYVKSLEAHLHDKHLGEKSAEI
ncbi:hypothetical protein J4440_03780 [Candidatus Woesearchaeota archaeon]|nr:hypothetical protein [Candidatus Woesearchaeota archaeon]